MKTKAYLLVTFLWVSFLGFSQEIDDMYFNSNDRPKIVASTTLAYAKKDGEEKVKLDDEVTFTPSAGYTDRSVNPDFNSQSKNGTSVEQSKPSYFVPNYQPKNVNKTLYRDSNSKKSYNNSYARNNYSCNRYNGRNSSYNPYYSSYNPHYSSYNPYYSSYNSNLAYNSQYSSSAYSSSPNSFYAPYYGYNYGNSYSNVNSINPNQYSSSTNYNPLDNSRVNSRKRSSRSSTGRTSYDYVVTDRDANKVSNSDNIRRSSSQMNRNTRSSNYNSSSYNTSTNNSNQNGANRSRSINYGSSNSYNSSQNSGRRSSNSSSMGSSNSRTSAPQSSRSRTRGRN